MASNQRATSWFRAAEPEMKKRIRPPKRSRILVPMSLSAMAYLRASSPLGFLPLLAQLADLAAHAAGPDEELVLEAALAGHHRRDPAVGLLEDAGRGAHEGRPDDGEVVDDLVDPPVDGGGEADLQRQGEQHLAEDVRQREPEVLQVVLGEDVDGRPGGRGPRRSRRCAAAGRPWAGRWSPRCR